MSIADCCGGFIIAGRIEHIAGCPVYEQLVPHGTCPACSKRFPIKDGVMSKHNTFRGMVVGCPGSGEAPK